ncbi:hypothetical protein [Phaeobacter sp. B1627]|nr:hypothetical protein [Phaeobacter sp. B1627]
MLKSADDGCLTAWEKESRFEIIFKRAKGATAEDVDGKVFLDLTSCSG